MVARRSLESRNSFSHVMKLLVPEETLKNPVEILHSTLRIICHTFKNEDMQCSLEKTKEMVGLAGTPSI